MRRRNLLVTLAAASAGASAVAGAPRVLSLDDALRWLDRLEAAPRPPTVSGAWPLGTVLAHLAQSVEMSLDGYPAPRSALFQRTAGSAAFAFFRWRGRMQHGLAEPIPGAPALPTMADWRPGAQRLRQTIDRFQAHVGPLQPHFAYGPLDRRDYALAHALHIANHQDEIAVL